MLRSSELGDLVQALAQDPVLVLDLGQTIREARIAIGDVAHREPIAGNTKAQGKLVEHLERGDTSAGFDAADVRRRAARERKLPLGQADFLTCALESETHRHGRVDVGSQRTGHPLVIAENPSPSHWQAHTMDMAEELRRSLGEILNDVETRSGVVWRADTSAVLEQDDHLALDGDAAGAYLDAA